MFEKLVDHLVGQAPDLARSGRGEPQSGHVSPCARKALPQVSQMLIVIGLACASRSSRQRCPSRVRGNEASKCITHMIALFVQVHLATSGEDLTNQSPSAIYIRRSKPASSGDGPSPHT